MIEVSLVNQSKPTKAKPSRRVWCLRWVVEGKRYYEHIGEVGRITKRDAERIRRKKEADMNGGLIPSHRPDRLRLADFLRLDREAVHIDRKATSIQEMRIAASHAVAALGDVDIGSVDHAAVGRIKRYLKDTRQVSNATIHKTIRTLSGAWTRGLKNKRVITNPFSGVELPKVQEPAIRTYLPDEVVTMIGAADSWWATLIRTAYTSGLRKNELLNLQWSDIDFDAATITVNAKRRGTFTAGERSYPILEWSTKSSRPRTVPTPADTLAALRRLQVQMGGSSYVFLSLDRLAMIGLFLATHGSLSAGYPLTNSFSRDFTRIQARAGIIGRTFHDLRRTYASTMARVVSMHELQRLLGHASIETTAKYYTAPGDDLAARCRSAFA